MLSKSTAVLAAALLWATSALAGSEKVLFSFTGGNDGSHSHSALTYHNGSFYGATAGGGAFNSGVVFQLQLVSGVWVETVLYTFTGGSDGGAPFSDVIFDAAGNIFGTTSFGGTFAQGNVYKLTPSGSGYTETSLYTFTGGADGGFPFQQGRLLLDRFGNLFGTTDIGGAYGFGTVFELTPSGSSWTETVLYSFTGGADGGYSNAGVVASGNNVYGVTYSGGSSGNGAVFQLANSNGGWTENVIYSFANGTDGANPEAALLLDKAGNLYGTTYAGGAFGFGTAFKLVNSGSTWTETLLHTFAGGSDGASPLMAMTADNRGNLYGTTLGAWTGGAFGYGTVFKLSPSKSGWVQTVLYAFADGSDGANPYDAVAFLNNKLYGTARSAGADKQGVIFEITP